MTPVIAAEATHVYHQYTIRVEKRTVVTGNLDEAEYLLADARAIDASSSELTTAEAALANERQAIIDAQRQAELAAQRRAAAEAEAERTGDVQAA